MCLLFSLNSRLNRTILQFNQLTSRNPGPCVILPWTRVVRSHCWSWWRDFPIDLIAMRWNSYGLSEAEFWLKYSNLKSLQWSNYCYLLNSASHFRVELIQIGSELKLDTSYFTPLIQKVNFAGRGLLFCSTANFALLTSYVELDQNLKLPPESDDTKIFIEVKTERENYKFMIIKGYRHKSPCTRGICTISAFLSCKFYLHKCNWWRRVAYSTLLGVED